MRSALIYLLFIVCFTNLYSQYCSSSSCSSCTNDINCYGWDYRCFWTNTGICYNFSNCAAPNVRIESSSLYSFDVKMNGSSTSEGGYIAIANINGVETSRLQRGVPNTTDGVQTTLRVWNDNCTTVVVEWTLVNLGSRTATVGVCLYGDTYINDNNINFYDLSNWTSLSNNHGVYTQNYPFYVQAAEPFSGAHGGSGYLNQCSSNTVSTMSDGDLGISVNWNGILVDAGTTRVFQMMFSSYEENFPPSCSSDTCSSCIFWGGCYDLDELCYYSAGTCINSSDTSSCTTADSSCTSCKTSSECSNRGCMFNSTNKWCSSCSSNTCFSCADSASCLGLSSTCSWSGADVCYNSSSYCSGSSCLSCNSQSSCTGLDSTYCSWDTSCFNSSSYCSTQSCSSCIATDACSELNSLCTWNASTFSCYNASSYCSSENSCSSCNSADACYEHDSVCYYYDGACINSSVLSSCTTGSCSDCESLSECANRACTWAANRTCSLVCTGSPNVSIIAASYSFEVLLNNLRTTYGSNGYNTVANINGVQTSTLKPNMANITGGVQTILRVWNENCTTVIAEWTLVNMGSSSATVGVCIFGDSSVGSNMGVNWASLSNNHGIYTTSYPFYVQAEESFSGTYGGSEFTGRCLSNDVSTLPSPIVSGMSVNWNGFKLDANATKVFKMTFSNYEESFPPSCFSDTCSSCMHWYDCYSVDAMCYYSGSSCTNSSETLSCAANSSCAACKSSSECSNRGCTFTPTTRSCSSCSSNICSSCTDSASCWGLNSIYCLWSNANVCRNRSSLVCTSGANVSVVTASNSFEVNISGSRTTLGGSGYTTVANINGVQTSTLKPNLANITGGVQTILRVWNENCTTVIAEWTLVNMGSSSATVGVCLYGDSYMGTSNVSWSSLSNSRGLWSYQPLFYIQAEEPFSGTYGGNSPSGRCLYNNVSTSGGSYTGISVNWNGIVLDEGATRVFQMMFSNNEVIFPSSCSSDTCSSCLYSFDCYNLDDLCYYSAGGCINSSEASSCTADSLCTACKSSSECTDRGCMFNSTNKSCHFCFSSECSSCTNSASCLGLSSTWCLWGGANICHNSSSYCSGSSCVSCNSRLSCVDLDSTCSWNRSCFNSSSYCSAQFCSTCNGAEACSDLNELCMWNTTSSLCYNSSSYCSSENSCSSCNSIETCYLHDNVCYYSAGACANSSVSPTCETTACGYCKSLSECERKNCSWEEDGTCNLVCTDYPKVSLYKTSNSFEIFLNGSLTTYSPRGYSTIANINGVQTGVLIPDLADTTGGVETTLRVWNESCTMVIVEWTLVNLGSSSATVGVCLYGNSRINSNDGVGWTSLLNNHGMYTTSYPFYIQAAESFSGVYGGGSYSSRCLSNTVSTASSSDTGISVNWNGFSLDVGATKVFQMMFSNYEETFPSSCSLDICSSCYYSRDCYDLDDVCYYSAGACFNSSETSSCTAESSCTDCKSSSECSNRGCTFNSINKSCSSCSSSGCSSCTDSGSCSSLSIICLWNDSNVCFNSSSYCSGSLCSSCNSQSSCLGLDSTGCSWNTLCFNSSSYCSNENSCSSCNSIDACYFHNSVCYYSADACINSSVVSSCTADSSCATCKTSHECLSQGCIFSSINKSCSSCSSSTCSSCTDPESCSSLSSACLWSDSDICYDSSSYCSGSMCISCNSYSSCVNLDSICSWSMSCVNFSSYCSAQSCSTCNAAEACYDLNELCMWNTTSSVCYNSSSYCSSENSCSSCNSVDACYLLDSACYYSANSCINSSNNPSCGSGDSCSSCRSLTDCTTLQSCAWTSFSCKNCSEVVFNYSNPGGPCGKDCVYQNRTCDSVCSSGFHVDVNNPGYCENDTPGSNDHVIIDTSQCSSSFSSCLELYSSESFEMSVYVEVLVNLDADLTFGKKNFDFEGMNSESSIINVHQNQIVFNSIESNSNCTFSYVTITRDLSIDSESVELSIIRAVGSSTSSNFVLLDVNVIYSYLLTTASQAVIVIEKLIFQLVNVNINHSSFENSVANRRVHNDDYVDGCAVTTSHTAVRLVNSSGTFSNVVFSNIDTGALFIDGGNVIFDNVEFKNNVIPGFSAFSALRHNVFISGTNLTVKEAKSDVKSILGESSLFVTSAPGDTSKIIILATKDVSLMYIPKADKFSFENNVRGKFSGNFLPCTYTVNIAHFDTHIGVLPLIVDTETTAYFELPTGTDRSTGNYTFHFLYTVGNYTGKTPDFFAMIAKDNGNESNKSQSKNWIIVVVVVSILVVVGAVLLTVVVVYKKKLKCNFGESQNHPGDKERTSIVVSKSPVEQLGRIEENITNVASVPDFGKETLKSVTNEKENVGKNTEVELEVFEVEKDKVEDDQV